MNVDCKEQCIIIIMCVQVLTFVYLHSNIILCILLCICVYSMCMIVCRVSYRGGGALGYPPPRSSFPPPRISYHNVIMNQIENCTSINAYRLMRLFFCLNMSKISAKLTEFSSGPSIAIRMSLVKLESFNRFRSRVFIIFI